MKSILKEILSTSIYIFAVLIVTFLIVKFVGVRVEVVGPSMESTLQNGENLIVEKLSYHFTEPERFDIIVFPFKHAEKTNYIKRIIGLPGEQVQIDLEGNIYINGEILEESFGKEVIKDPGIAIDPIYLSDDEYFVLGDNRNNSSDSRMESVGNIQRKDIIGRAWIKIWPFSEFGSIDG